MRVGDRPKGVGDMIEVQKTGCEPGGPTLMESPMGIKENAKSKAKGIKKTWCEPMKGAILLLGLLSGRTPFC